MDCKLHKIKQSGKRGRRWSRIARHTDWTANEVAEGSGREVEDEGKVTISLWMADEVAKGRGRGVEGEGKNNYLFQSLSLSSGQPLSLSF